MKFSERSDDGGCCSFSGTYLIEELVQHGHYSRCIGLHVQAFGRLVQVHEHGVHKRMPLETPGVALREKLVLHLREGLHVVSVKAKGLVIVLVVLVLVVLVCLDETDVVILVFFACQGLG